MSISAINAALSGQLGASAQLVNTTLHYIDGGRIQLIASTIVDTNGQRQTLLRHFVGQVDVAASAKQMAADWQAGALAAVVTQGEVFASPTPVKPSPATLVTPPADATPAAPI